VSINKVNVKNVEYLTFVLNRMSSSTEINSTGHAVIYLIYPYIRDKFCTQTVIISWSILLILFGFNCNSSGLSEMFTPLL